MDIINFLLDLLIFLGVLSVLVLVHEAGHFWAAKKAGIKVEEFGLGFPPRVWGKRRGETIFSLNAIPIGGFVKLYGEEEKVDTDKSRAYYHKGKFARTLVVVCGVLMNVLLAAVLFSVVVLHQGILRESGHVRVSGIAPDSPAQKAILSEGNIIEKINGQKVSNNKEFQEVIGQNLDREITLTIGNHEATREVKVTPRANPPEGQGALGITINDREIYKPPFPENVLVAGTEGVKQVIFWGDVTISGIKSIFSQASKGQAPEGVSGPVGIFQIVSAIRREGLLPLLIFAGVLSVNLAILNIMPFPALDGGRLLFILVETLFGKRVLPAFEKHAHAVGMIILLGIVVLITLNDIKRVIQGISVLP